MLIRIDTNRSSPLHDQIAGAIRRAIAGGEVTAGERLPPARELASSLEVSIHTVLAAYQQLRDEGLIELRRGRGATVRDNAAAGHAGVVELARGLVDAARHIGLSDDELLALVQDAAR